MTKPPAGALSKVPEVTLEFLGHQGAGDDIGRDRRRCRNNVDRSGLCNWQLHLYRHFRRHRRRANLRGGIRSLPVLGHDRRDDNLGHNDGGFRRSFAQHRLFRRIVKLCSRG